MENTQITKLASGAGSIFNRAKQYAEERLGQADRTQFDPAFAQLLRRADMTKLWTEKIVKNTECLLEPSQQSRLEGFLYDKMERKRPDKKNNKELLGAAMVDAGNDIGPTTAYGSALVKTGQTQLKMGQAERDATLLAVEKFTAPLQRFLDAERQVLESKRLDLDVAKTKLKRAKAKEVEQQAEEELKVAQAEFERQVEITRLLLEGVSSTHAHHLRCLHDLVDAQAAYYTQCQNFLSDLQQQLERQAESGKQND